MSKVVNVSSNNALSVTPKRNHKPGNAKDRPVSATPAIHMSTQLLAARMEANVLPGFPGNPPTSLEESYRIQNTSMEQWPDEVVGWKVGGIPESLRGKLNADWLVGPIFKRSVKQMGNDANVAMPVFDGGFAAIEPELVVLLGANRSEDRLFIGAEIASSPVPAINDYGPTAVVCDFGNNNGLLVGAEISDWQSDREQQEVSIWIDEELIATKLIKSLAKSISPALQFCLAHAARQNRKLPPGTLVSTGAITGIHEASPGTHSKISFGQLGALHLQLTQAVRLDEQGLG